MCLQKSIISKALFQANVIELAPFKNIIGLAKQALNSPYALLLNKQARRGMAVS